MFIKSLSPKLILLIATFVLTAGIAVAQDEPQPNQPPTDRQPNDDRSKILSQLGLTMDQIQQFRRVNQAHRPEITAAVQRLREANRELDMAIYADTVSEETVQTKLRAFHAAQAEVNKLRFMNELAIRKILTPDQLTLFREIRRRFAEARDRLFKQPQRPFRNNGQPRNANPGNPLVDRNQQPKQVDRPIKRVT